VEMLFM
jgi:hypothetical protein